MPRLDVSSVLLDPMFVDRSLICIQQTQTVDDFGINHDKQRSIPFCGVVTSASGASLQRGPEGFTVESTITIHTRFRLSDGKSGRDADLVQWDGNQYTVVNVANYSKYGRGFIAATAGLIPLSGGK